MRSHPPFLGHPVGLLQIMGFISNEGLSPKEEANFHPNPHQGCFPWIQGGRVLPGSELADYAV